MASRLTRVLALTLIGALLAAGLASAAPRTFEGAFGKISMPREATEVRIAPIRADITLNASLAKEAGAKYVLLSVGSDVNTALAVEPGKLERADGTVISVDRVENAGTNRVNWWLMVSSLPATLKFTLNARADVGEKNTDVETLVMAFDGNYREVKSKKGQPLTLQSFTTVKTGNATTPPPDDDFGSPGNGTGGPGGVDPNADDDPVDDSNPPPERRRAPGPGLALMLAGAAAAAAVASHRRRA